MAAGRPAGRFGVHSSISGPPLNGMLIITGHRERIKAGVATVAEESGRPNITITFLAISAVLRDGADELAGPERATGAMF